MVDLGFVGPGEYTPRQKGVNDYNLYILEDCKVLVSKGIKEFQKWDSK